MARNQPKFKAGPATQGAASVRIVDTSTAEITLDDGDAIWVTATQAVAIIKALTEALE